MGTNSALVAPVDLHEGVPDTGIRSRELKVFGAIEVAHHRLLPGEVEALPLQVAPGQPAPERLVPPNTATQRTHAREARGHGRRRYGGSPRFAPSLGRWHHTYGGKGADLSVVGGSERSRHEHVGVIHHISDPKSFEAAEEKALDLRWRSIIDPGRQPRSAARAEAGKRK